MKLCIAGSRTIDIPPMMIDLYLSHTGIKKSDIDELICGMAPDGADLSGLGWAILNKIRVSPFPANWKKYDKAAGPIRNKEMAKECDCALIFWDGQSKGTKNMMENLDRLKKPYYTVIVTEVWHNKADIV